MISFFVARYLTVPLRGPVLKLQGEIFARVSIAFLVMHEVTLLLLHTTHYNAIKNEVTMKMRM